MKMEPSGNGAYEFTDTFQTRTGKEVVLRHELKKLSDGEMKGIYEKTDQNEWQPFYAMNMSK